MAGLFASHTGRPADVDTMRRWIDGHPSAGAEVDGTLVGYVLSTRLAPQVLELTSLLVAPDHRGRGLGGRLLDAVERDAADQGWEALITTPSAGYEVLGPKQPSTPLFVGRGWSVLLETTQTAVVGRRLEVPS
ncbi:MAG: GNAT family N-acetyltransferase [Acidimicrobiales bacterium]|nr:GNAT family N-acetyltransferase [Acidimicrobiales bacterium]